MMTEQLKNELNELFKNGHEEVYFRDSKIDNGITERFKDKENDKVLCFILCEYEPYENDEVNLHYNHAYGGSDKLAKITTKYKLNHEWEDCCVAYLYVDDYSDDNNE